MTSIVPTDLSFCNSLVLKVLFYYCVLGAHLTSPVQTFVRAYKAIFDMGFQFNGINKGNPNFKEWLRNAIPSMEFLILHFWD